VSEPRASIGASASARDGTAASGASRSGAQWKSSAARALLLALALLVAACQTGRRAAGTTAGEEETPEPAIANLRIEPARLCYGDPFHYAFDYRDIPSGLIAVQDVAVVARPRRGGDRPTSLWDLIPDFDERARYTAPTGSFRSGARYWRPRDPAPKNGMDLAITLTLTLAYGEQVSTGTAIRFDGNCPAPPLSASAESRTGRLAFDTMTLSTTQFLTGERQGTPARIWGDLRLPPETSGRVPAVILMHGSEGVGRRETRWAEELNRIGVAAFIMDSLTGRQFEGATPELSTGSLIIDVYRALGFLAGHSRIDPTRVALMGFSRGGVVTLYASLDRFRRVFGPPGVEFAAHLSFYPGCLLTYIDEEHVTDRPIRLFHGTADDWTAIGPCRDYVERLRRAGKDVELKEYPGAQHAFDAPYLPAAIHLPRPVNTFRCLLVEHEGGRVVNRETGRTFAFTDACVFRGATLGYEPRAHHDAIKAVTTLLGDLFERGR
jgi:dienelactone hydrolase